MILHGDPRPVRRTAMRSQARATNLRLSWRGLVPCTMLVLLAVGAAGCSRKGPPPRKMVPVSGTITLDGKPLPDGFVSFVSPTEGHFETFPIAEGNFAGKAGLGLRSVEITAVRDAQPQPSRGGGNQGPLAAMRTNYLPAKYSANSKLRADVTEAGPNTFTFELTMGK